VREQERAAGDERDVLTRDREEVVQARSAKPLLQALGQPFVFPEHDPGDDRLPLAAEPGRHRTGQSSPKPVGEP
jgi:hypothetical protein